MAGRKPPQEPPQQPPEDSAGDGQPEEAGDNIQRFIRSEISKGLGAEIHAQLAGAIAPLQQEMRDLVAGLNEGLAAGLEQIRSQVPSVEAAAEAARQKILQEAAAARRESPPASSNGHSPAQASQGATSVVVNAGGGAQAGQQAMQITLTPEEMAQIPPQLRIFLPMINNVGSEVSKGIAQAITHKLVGLPGPDMNLAGFDTSKLTMAHIRKIATDPVSKDLFFYVADDLAPDPIAELIPRIKKETWDQATNTAIAFLRPYLRANKVPEELLDVLTPDQIAPMPDSSSEPYLLTRTQRQRQHSARSTSGGGNGESRSTSSAGQPARIAASALLRRDG